MGEEEKAKEAAPPADKVKEAEEKKGEGGGGEEKKNEAPSLPPPPPEEVVMRVFMHCEGCARKVKKILKGFDGCVLDSWHTISCYFFLSDFLTGPRILALLALLFFHGVEDVIADTKAHKVVVKGKKAAADPMKVVERVQKKTGRKVELLSPMPPPKEEKKEEEKKEEPEPPKTEKKEEATVLAVVLKVHMHCVQSVEADLKASQVTVKGVFEEAKLSDYVYRRTGKHAAIVKSEPVAAENVDDGNAKDDKKAAEGGEEKKDDGKEEKKDEDKKEADKQKDDGNAGDEGKDKDPGAVANMYMHYPRSNHLSEYGYAYQYPPQLFSDENPNACSLM
ncbi:Heavy metal-associated isoprenylated plant protein 7 [Zea mays]|uniref:Heavy metal-associated isoprenylated plant protein 7 n=1 Tax=Zea mays TaxID=4577 RepID=A0A3L6EJD5_MAIZE|nr:Heavy metal-associated isoprenylated plant protein 7 [Zea mays]